MDEGRGMGEMVLIGDAEPQTIIVMVAMASFLALTVILPWKKRANATSVIALGITVVFMLQFVLSLEITYDLIPFEGWERAGGDSTIDALGFRPRAVVDDLEFHRFITSTMLHADAMHLIMNFIGLFILGTQLERKVGWQRLLLYYFGSGIVAGAVVLLVSPFNILGQSMGAVSIGASGCIYGLLGAYWFLYPRDEVVFPLILIRKWPISLIVLVYIGISATYILLNVSDDVSHIAHFAGFVGAFPIAALARPVAEEVGKAPLKSADVKGFESLARTKGQKSALKRAIDADEQEVRDAWLDDFFRRLDCPKCGSRGMRYSQGRGECSRCGKVIRP